LRFAVAVHMKSQSPHATILAGRGDRTKASMYARVHPLVGREEGTEDKVNGPFDEELPPVLSPLEIPGTAMLQQVQSEPNRKVGMQRAHLARVVWLRSSCAPAEDSAFAPLCLCTS